MSQKPMSRRLRRFLRDAARAEAERQTAARARSAHRTDEVSPDDPFMWFADVTFNVVRQTIAVGQSVAKAAAQMSERLRALQGH